MHVAHAPPAGQTTAGTVIGSDTDCLRWTHACGPMHPSPAGQTAAETVIGSETDFLRLDSLIMVCQLNVHAVTGQKGLQPLNIICEKMGIGGATRCGAIWGGGAPPGAGRWALAAPPSAAKRIRPLETPHASRCRGWWHGCRPGLAAVLTQGPPLSWCLPFCRFEDRYRLPLGVGLNMTSYAAKIMSEVWAHCCPPTPPGFTVVPPLRACVWCAAGLEVACGI